MQRENQTPYTLMMIAFMFLVLYLAGVGSAAWFSGKDARMEANSRKAQWMTLCIKEQRADGYPPDRAKTRCSLRSLEVGRKCR